MTAPFSRWPSPTFRRGAAEFAGGVSGAGGEAGDSVEGWEDPMVVDGVMREIRMITA